MRITLSDVEVLDLLTITKPIDEKIHNAIYHQYKAYTRRDKSKKVQSIKEATKHRSEVAKRKISNAMNLLQMLGCKLTIYSISKESGCSYNTVKKYKDLGDE